MLEGGSIDVNGRGTLITTEECLLSTTQQRNPHMDRTAYEQMFADYFGVQSVIWLGDGIEGDDTHGHVDDLDALCRARYGRHDGRAERAGCKLFCAAPQSWDDCARRATRMASG